MSQQTNSKTLIIVEDDIEIASVLKEVLEPRFKSIQVANDGQAGFDLVAATLPDLILSDIAMPIMTGLEMIQKLRSNGFDTPVVFLTAHDEKDKLLAAMRLGALDLINKPFQIDDLVKTIDRVLYTVKKKEQIAELAKKEAPTEQIKKEKRMIGLMQATSVKKTG